LWISAAYADSSGVCPLLCGGIQEAGRRAGTENVAAIFGLALALEKALADMARKAEHVWKIRTRLEMGLMRAIPGVKFHSDPVWGLYNTTSLYFPRAIDSRRLQALLAEHGVSVNVGSACSKGQRSRVLTEMGVSEAAEGSTLRISLGPQNHSEEVDRVIDILADAYRALAVIASAGETYA